MEMQQRLEKLEKERWMYLGLGLLAVLAGLLGALLGAGLFGGGGGGDRLMARTLLVHDDNGKARISIGMKDGRPEIVLLDKEGKRKAEFNIDEEDLPRLAFVDNFGTRRQRLGLETGGDPKIEIFDLNNRPLSTLDGDSLRFFNAAGIQTYVAPPAPSAPKPTTPAPKPTTAAPKSK